jgi:hypothetical protein
MSYNMIFNKFSTWPAGWHEYSVTVMTIHCTAVTMYSCHPAGQALNFLKIRL